MYVSLLGNGHSRGRWSCGWYSGSTAGEEMSMDGIYKDPQGNILSEAEWTAAVCGQTVYTCNCGFETTDPEVMDAHTGHGEGCEV